MILGWPPSKIVSVDTDFQPRWPPSSNIEKAGILNVIFYQNMPNLHNRYISAERKIAQKNPEFMLNYFCHVAAVKI
jgi:hypothetical protein